MESYSIASLKQYQGSAISLATSTPTTTDIYGNTIRAVSTVTFSSGQTTSISDVVLQNNQLDSVFLRNSNVSTAAAASLDLKGYGNVKNLDVAMTGDATLLTMVTNFKTLAATSTGATLKNAADNILFRWAGVNTVVTAINANDNDRNSDSLIQLRVAV